MLAVVKTPRIDLCIQGELPPRLLRCLRMEFGKKLHIEGNQEEEYVNFMETDFYRDIKKKMTPGAYVCIYRENHNMTQEEVGEKVGASKSFICDVEHNRRSISKEMAKKFAGIFKVSVARFI